MTLTERGIVLGALLAKLDDKALPIEADQVRIWTLLSVTYGEKISRAVLRSLRRAKHCRDSSGADWIVGHRRGRRLSVVAGGGADRRGRRAARACIKAGVRSPRRSHPIRSERAPCAGRKRPGKRPVDVVWGYRAGAPNTHVISIETADQILDCFIDECTAALLLLISFYLSPFQSSGDLGTPSVAASKPRI
jgi:hypothetical protein